MNAPSSTLAAPAGTHTRTPVRARALAVVGGVVGGVALAMAWSAAFVDTEIGLRVANSALGQDVRQTAIASSVGGLAFAFVSGFAGTFTACNIAVFGALPAVAGRPGRRAQRIRDALGPLGWLGAGVLAVAVLYGTVAVLIGPALFQLSTATVGNGMPARLLESVVVFGLIGLAFGYLGLAALGFAPDPFAERPRARLVVLGVLIGGFLVGRPYPLFRKLLEYAVQSDNPLYGALAMVLQALGNIVVMAALALALAASTRFVRWLSRPGRAAMMAGVALLVLGTFLIVYWDIRLPARFGYGWFPTMPWNG